MQVEGTYPLGQGAFNASPVRIELLEFLGRLVWARGLPGLMVDLCPDGAGPRFGLRADLGRTHWTRLTVFFCKADLDHVLPRHIVVGLPLPTLFALWTRGRVRLPPEATFFLRRVIQREVDNIRSSLLPNRRL